MFPQIFACSSTEESQDSAVLCEWPVWPEPAVGSDSGRPGEGKHWENHLTGEGVAHLWQNHHGQPHFIHGFYLKYYPF